MAWTEAGGFIDLYDLLARDALSRQWQDLAYALRVTAIGDIVGYGTVGGQNLDVGVSRCCRTRYLICFDFCSTIDPSDATSYSVFVRPLTISTS